MATYSFFPDGSANNCNVSVSTDADQHPGVPTEANILAMAFISLSLARRDGYGQASGLDSVGDMHRR